MVFRSKAPRIPRTKKPKQHEKRIPYKLIPRDTDQGKKLYALLKQATDKWHDELSNASARIALAWALGWKPDADGITKLGKIKKASDLDRELAPFDFVILLHKEWWENLTSVTDEQRLALLDHELTHATVRYDRQGEPLRDERGRTMFRMRKHDIEEFTEVLARQGTYKRSLEVAGAALMRRQKDLPMDEPAPAKAAKSAEATAH